jgi:MG2 domain/Carboxypeptidase regulatory-like domain
MDADIDIVDRETVHVETDKMLHKPGETVHLRSLMMDDTGKAEAGKKLTIKIQDGEGKDVLEAALVTNRFGIASYDWKTGAQLAPGNYHAQFEPEGSTDYTGWGWIGLEMRRYDLPEFAVSAALNRGYYLDGQTPVVKLHAGYLFGKAVAAGMVRVVRAEQSWWNGTTTLKLAAQELTATLNERGDAELKLDEADEFAGLKGDPAGQRYRDVQFTAYVTDGSTGRTEPRNFTVRLTQNPVHIYLNRTGGNDREGDYIVSTAYADGAPTACKVTLDWMNGEPHAAHAATVTTSRYGLARMHLRFPSAGDNALTKVRLTARDAEGQTSIFDDTVTAGEATSIWITAGASLMKPGQNIEAVVHGPVGAVVDVDAVSANGVISHHRVPMMHTMEPMTVTMGEDFRGVVTLVAYLMNGDEQSGCPGLCAVKSELYPEDRELKLTGLETSYLPGAEVNAGVEVKAAGGFAAPGALGVSVADAAVELRAMTEEDANQRWGNWSWWRNTSNIGGVTWEELQQTDMSQPVSDDLQQVAEAALQNGVPFAVDLEAEDYTDSENEYEAGISKQLKPVGDAVLAARPERLPTTLDGVKAIADAAGLDAALLRDPWEMPYKVRVEKEWNAVALSAVSAGPDKRFGTQDDFSVQVAQRNIFALPGEQLNKILKDRMSAGGPLPGTVDELKQMARAGGLDLDRALDPDGYPYQYQIGVGPRWYDVQVYGHDAKPQENGRLQWPVVWTSAYVDYFRATEARMQEAINAWTNAGHAFPMTQEDARAAFTAVGIDFDTLRDPLGQRFQLVTNEQTSYTRIETVRAGGTLEETNKPVTHVYRAVQVLAAPNVVNGKTTNEVVAQFLHPLTEQSGSDAKPVAVNGGMFTGSMGAIAGTVTDATGAVIAGATVMVKAYGATVTTEKSLANGTYLTSDLDGGFYSVEIAAGGFETTVVQQVHVAPLALTTVNVELKVGAATATVTVTDAPPMLSTTDAALAGKAPSQYSSLPLSMSGAPRRGFGFSGKQKGTQAKDEPTFTPRLRHVFEETAYWAREAALYAAGQPDDVEAACAGVDDGWTDGCGGADVPDISAAVCGRGPATGANGGRRDRAAGESAELHGPQRFAAGNGEGSGLADSSDTGEGGGECGSGSVGPGGVWIQGKERGGGGCVAH